MQESPQLKEDQKLERRKWVGCLLEYVLALPLGIFIVLIIMLPRFLVSVDSAQQVWAVLLCALPASVAILVVGIAGLVLWFRLMAWSLEAERKRHQRSAAVFRQTLPELALVEEAPVSTLLNSSRQLAGLPPLLVLYAVGIIIAVLIMSALVDRRLVGLPSIVGAILAVALILGGYRLFSWMIEQVPGKPRAVLSQLTPPMESPAQGRAKPGRSRAVGNVLYFILALVPVIGALALALSLPAPPLLLPILVVGACAVAFTAVRVIYVIVPFLWILRAAKRGEYDRALARARLVESLSIFPGFYLNTHGVILLWAGRYEEALKTFEESIGEQRKEAMGAGSGALENIGCTLAWQGQYDEAIKMFEGSIAIAPQQAMVYSDLAEALLYQGVDLPRALELTERAWNNQQAALQARWLSSYERSQILANRAWALALLGHYQEAEETLARAFAVADKRFKPVLAGIYLRAGYVMLARGERTRADEYFARGRRLDAQGHYGRLCAEARQLGSNT
jgi:Tfp pilus assembly protein PilF